MANFTGTKHDRLTDAMITPKMYFQMEELLRETFGLSFEITGSLTVSDWESMIAEPDFPSIRLSDLAVRLTYSNIHPYYGECDAVEEK